MDSTNNPVTPNPLAGVGAPSTPAATPAPEVVSTASSTPAMGTVIPAPADVSSAGSTGGDKVAEALKRIEDKLNAVATKVGA